MTLHTVLSTLINGILMVQTTVLFVPCFPFHHSSHHRVAAAPAPAPAPSTTTSCPLVNRFIGKDGGIVVPVALTYDITVSTGTTRTTVANNLLPIIERQLAKHGASRLIKDCVPAGSTTSGNINDNIMGIDLDPRDSVLGKCEQVTVTTPATTGPCFTVHSEAILFVQKSSANVERTYLSTMTGLLTATKNNLITVNQPSILSIKNVQRADPTTVVSTRSGKPSQPNNSPSGPPAKQQPNNNTTSTNSESTASDWNTVVIKFDEVRRTNPVLFYGTIVGIVLGLILIIAACAACGVFGYEEYRTTRGGRVVKVKR